MEGRVASHMRMRWGRGEVRRRTVGEVTTGRYATETCLVGHHLPIGLHELAQSVLEMIRRRVPRS